MMSRDTKTVSKKLLWRGLFSLLLLISLLLASSAVGQVAQTPIDGVSLKASTLIGGSGVDRVTDIAVGPDGSVYLVGWTESSDFPTTPGAADITLGGERDAFVARLSPDMTLLLASTYLGGATGTGGGGVGSWDAANALIIDSDAVHVVGYTYTTDFPVSVDAFDTNNEHGGASAFVARLSLDLGVVEAATYLGEMATDIGYTLALDFDGSVYAAGFTIGFDFPTTPGAYDQVGGPYQDVFISHFSRDLTTLIASTLIPRGIATDVTIGADGAVFMAGQTYDPDYPTTPGAYDRVCGTDGFCNPGPFGEANPDVVLSRLDGDLTTLEASTFLGHDRDDSPNAIQLDGEGGIYVSGTSSSSAFPTTSGAYQTTSNGFNTIFISRLSIDLSSLEVSTRLGGFEPLSPSEGFDLLILNEQVCVTGETFADDFPTTPDAADSIHQGGNEVIVSVLDRQLTTLTYSTFLGGTAGSIPEEDQGRALAVAADGSLFVSGQTISPTFPTTSGAYQEFGSGDFDGFAASLEAGVVVATEEEILPESFRLGQNYPNPSMLSTAIPFTLAEDAAVAISVYDMLGQEVLQFDMGTLRAGSHRLPLDLSDLASGAYVYGIRAEAAGTRVFQAARRLLFLR